MERNKDVATFLEAKLTDAEAQLQAIHNWARLRNLDIKCLPEYKATSERAARLRRAIKMMTADYW